MDKAWCNWQPIMVVRYSLRRLLVRAPGLRSGLVLVCCCLAVAGVQAQNAIAPEDASQDDSLAQVLMLSPREYQQRLKQTERAIEQGDYGEAIEILGSFLETNNDPAKTDAPAREDFFLGKPGDVQLQGSLRSEARRLLARLPAAGKELYRLQYGAEAERILQAGLESHDVEKLSQVARQYFHTTSGHSAAMLLGWHYLDQGQPLAATMYFSRLVQDDEARTKLDPGLSVQLARSWLLAQQPERARETLQQLQQRIPDAQVTIAGQSVALFAAGSDPLTLLERTTAGPQRSASFLQEAWTQHRGVASRNPNTEGGRLLPRMRWRVPVVNDPEDELLIQDMIRSYREEDLAPIPSISPLVVGNTVLMRTSTELLAVDLQSGKRLWPFPWSQDHAVQATANSGGLSRRDTHRSQLEERIWMDAAYGQLASDGESVFLLDELPFATLDSAATANAFLFRNLQADASERTHDDNYLVSLELKTEGKYRWRIGGATGDDEPRLAHAFFLGAPLVLGDELFVIAEIRGDISVFALETRTGKLRWSQQLAHVGQFTITMDSVRRLAGATAAYADGILVCPTSAGALVAIDVANRSLLWGHQYPRGMMVPEQGMRFNQIYAIAQQPGRDRWHDGCPIIGEGHVVVTPVEADQLLCLDLLTGQVKWSIPRDNEWLYVAAIHQHHVIVVGKSKVAAFGLDDGKETWQRSLRNSQDSEENVTFGVDLPSGRGFVNNDTYFLPLTRRLIEIDLRNGNLLRSTATQEPLGHLICHASQVFSLSADALVAYPQRDRLAAEVQTQLAANAHDPVALENAGLLALDEGNRTAALELLRRAWKTFATDDDRREGTKQLLIDTLLEVLEATQDAPPELLAEVEALVDRPVQRERFLRLVAHHRLVRGEADKSFTAYLELARHYQNAATAPSLDEQSEPQQIVSPGRSVRRDRWIRAGLRDAWRGANEAQRATIAALYREERDRVAAADGVAALQRFVRLFADHPATAQVRRDLAQRYLDAKEWLEAEQMLLPLLTHEDTEHAGQDWLTYAHLLERSGRIDMAAEAYRLIAQRWPQQPVDGTLTGSQLAAQYAPDSPLGLAIAGADRWRYGRVAVERSSANPTSMPAQFQPYANFHAVRSLSQSSPLPIHLRVMHDAPGQTSIVVQDRLGNERLRIPASAARVSRFTEGTMSCRSLGHLMVINIGHTLVAVDALEESATQEDRIRWPSNYDEILTANTGVLRHSSGRPIPSTNPWGQTSLRVTGQRIDAFGPVTTSGVTYIQANTLHCLDPLRGDTLWSQEGMPSEAEIWGDDEVVFVVAPGANEARVFDMVDGSDRGRRPIPPATARWSTIDRDLISWDERSVAGQYQWNVRRWDPWTNEEKWHQTFAAGSKGTLHSDGFLAIVEPDGRLTMLETERGQTLVSDQLEKSNRKMLYVQVLPFQSRWLLLRGFEPQSQRGVTYESFPEGFSTPLFDGDIYAYGRQDGKRLWQAPAVVQGYGIPLDQPEDLPALAFVRRTLGSENRSARRDQLELLIVDKRDGRLLLDANNLNFSYGPLVMMGNPADQTVTVRLVNQHHYSLHFTDEPQPPEPPVQTGSAASRTKGSGLSGIFGAVLDAFGQQVEKQGRQAEEDVKRMIEETEGDDAADATPNDANDEGDADVPSPREADQGPEDNSPDEGESNDNGPDDAP